MKKILYFFIILVSLINNVSALTELNNTNSTDFEHYNSKSVDTMYQLDSSDSLSKFSIVFDSWLYSYTQTYRFFDNNNNSLIIEFLYWETQDTFLQHTIHRNVTAYYNNIPLLLKKKSFYKTDYEAYEINDNAGTTNIFSNKDSLIVIIDFSADEIVIKSNIFSTLSIINNQVNTYVNLENSHYVSRIELPFSDNLKYEFTEIDINYIDSSISKFEYDLKADYNTLSIPFKMIFLVGKAVLKLANVLTLISDIDFYEYQKWFITPLQMLNIMINTIIFIIMFVFKNGILWFIGLSEMIIFIYAYITTNDLLDAIKKFVDYSKNFFTIIFINPIIWIYDNLLVKILRGA